MFLWIKQKKNAPHSSDGKICLEEKDWDASSGWKERIIISNSWWVAPLLSSLVFDIFSPMNLSGTRAFINVCYNSGDQQERSFLSRFEILVSVCA